MMQNPSPLVGDDSAYLHFRRESSCEGPFFLTVEVDSRDCAKLRKGGDRTLRVAPGEHRVKVRGAGGAIPAATMVQAGPREDVDLVLWCHKKNSFWDFPKSVVNIARRPWRGLVRGDGPTPSERTVDWARYRIEILDTKLTTEPAGQTEHVEDNSRSDGSSVRRSTVENEYVQTIVIGADTTETRGFAATLGVGWLTVAAKVENAVTSRWSIEQGRHQKVKEEVELYVPARTRITVVVHWKIIWQHGHARISGPAGSVDVPFRFIHSLNFDRYTSSM